MENEFIGGQSQQVVHRKPSVTNVFVEIYDNEGNIIEHPKKDVNIKVISTFKKFDESVFETMQEHPNAVLMKF